MPSPDGVGSPGRGQPAFNVPPATMAIAAAIVVMFAALKLLPDDWAGEAILALSVIPAEMKSALARLAVTDLLWEAGTLVGHVLVHVDWAHMLINLGFLLAFGSACERALGARTFVFIFVASAAAGAIVQIAADWGDTLLMYGASGGVSGAMGAVIRLMLADRDQPQRQRFALRLLTILVGLNVLFGLVGGALMGVDAEIAWQAHLGGLMAGFLLARPRRVDIVV